MEKFTQTPYKTESYLLKNLISAGGVHSLFRLPDGRLFSCGSNHHGQLGLKIEKLKRGGTIDGSKVVGVYYPKEITKNFNPNLKDGKEFVVEFDCDLHNLFVTNLGNAYTNGFQNHASLGSVFPTGDHNVPRLVTPFFKDKIHIRKVSAGLNTSLFLDENGVIYLYGENIFIKSGYVGRGRSMFQYTSIDMEEIFEGKKIIDISLGKMHGLFLDEDNIAYSGGFNHCGETGHGGKSFNKKIEIQKIKYFDNRDIKISMISAGENHSVFLNKEGDLYQSGKKYVVKRVVISKKKINKGKFIEYNIRDLPPADQTILLKELMGDEEEKEENVVEEIVLENFFYPRKVFIKSKLKKMERIGKISCGVDFTLLLTTLGRVFSYGHNKMGQLGLGHYFNTAKPTLIRLDDDGCFIDCSAGAHHSIFLTSKGNYYSCGSTSNGRLGVSFRLIKKKTICKLTRVQTLSSQKSLQKWTIENHHKFCVEFKFFVKFLLFSNKKSKEFSKVPKEVVLYRIIPFVEEFGVFYSFYLYYKRMNVN